MSDEALRALPSIDQLLREEALAPFIETAGRDNVRDRLREVLGELRTEIRLSQGQSPRPLTRPAVAEIVHRLARRFGARDRQRTQPVINAAGVVLHTNLGRAPLSPAALEAIREVAGGYCNLEYELESGRRGKRGSGLESML
ncbi:MAG: L-seryl-tRNA(Sec) selenium transferase, partial [Acidobacteriota bacterium]